MALKEITLQEAVDLLRKENESDCDGKPPEEMVFMLVRVSPYTAAYELGEAVKLFSCAGEVK